MSFVKIENTNDFIQPSSACIKPTEKKAVGVVTKVKDISLTDCLACSGCITSAESVLVQQQNHDELFRVINDNKQRSNHTHREIVVSLSLQSIASLAYKHSMTAQETAERLASFLISLGCDKVCDINVARHIALEESRQEFKERKQNGSPLPIISSVCPGWICYAEKTNGNLIIPHLSRVRSPQQIMGSLLKSHYRSQLGKSLYHVTLMPCFDKKLEASRDDFKNKIEASQDVDCVLTPIELETILQEEGVSLKDFDRRKLDVIIATTSELDEPLTSHLGSVSGSYAESVMLAVDTSKCKSDGDKSSPCDSYESIEYKPLRNNDFIELRIKGESASPESQAKFAIVNGFRNVQTIVQRLKRKALKYDYVEVMACPSGCINGGAQCRPNYGDDQDACVTKATQIYRQVKPVSLGGDTSIYSRLNLPSSKASKLLYTQFHSVPKMQNLSTNW